MGERDEVEELRAEVRRAQARGAAPRYGARLRGQILMMLAARGGRGEAAGAVAAELGVPYQTLLRWKRAEAKAARSKAGAFRRVSVVPEGTLATIPGFVLRGPSGLSVTGLTVTELAALWRSLLS